MAIENNLEAKIHQAQVLGINAAMGRHLVNREEGLRSIHARRVDKLHQGINDQLTELGNYSGQLAEIAGRYATIDALSPTSPTDRLALCLTPNPETGESLFDGIYVVSDFDKSMSMTDNPQVSERTYVMPNMPGSIPLEEHMDKYGRDQLAEGFVRHIQVPLRRRPDVYREGGKHAVKWRPGALELFSKLRALGIKRTILSANVEEFIRGAVNHTHLADDTELEIKGLRYNDISSTDKATAIQLLAARNPRLAVVYIGDGASDMKVVEAYKKGAIAAIFALENCEFERQLTEQGVPHFTYSNFEDIDAKLNESGCFAKAMQQKAA